MGAAVAIAGALVVVLALLLVRARREQRRLYQAVARSTQDLEHLERAFSRFAPESVVEQLGQGRTEIPPQRREVTVMFSDLVGFTRLSEEIPPDTLVPMLNDYFRRMSAVIREHHGHVSRIMGDGIMALFGALDMNAWQAADAVRAAPGMRAALAELNRELAAAGGPRLAFGVGLHRGEVLELMEFTVMGDVVNTAARVESLTRHHGVDILVTDAVRERLDERFRVRELPPAAVKGKAEPIRTWAVEELAE